MQPGDTLSGRYRLLRLVDVGGMGEVWAVRNDLTQRDFAIKFLLPELAEHPEALERFVREAATTGSLRHPSIVDVYDIAQTDDGQPYIVMELLVGESLEARLEREGQLSARRTAAYLSQIAQALELAHSAGVVHRDLSAANIFLARARDGGEPVPKILDFGVSKHLSPLPGDTLRTSNGAVLGCPAYMSPEQAMGAEGVDARTDVWSLGVVAYQCLAGTEPFHATNYNALMVAIMTQPHRPLRELVPSVERELESIIEACLCKDREQRPATARELAERLGAVARRLAEAEQALGLGPRRRASDRVDHPRAWAFAAAPTLLHLETPPGDPPTARRWLRALVRRRPPRAVVAVAGVLAGVLLGALLAGHEQPPLTEQARQSAQHPTR